MDSSKSIWAVLPVKSFLDAKQRLASAYDPRFRRTLMIAMVQDVLQALSQARSLSGTIVVTIDDEARELARSWGALVTQRGATGGHTAAVNGGISLIKDENLGGVLALPGDVPGVTGNEIDILVERHAKGPAFTISPSHDRRGSNGIVATPPDLVPLAYGDDSFLPHLATARARGIEPTIVELAGFGMDVDYPEDLDMLAAKPGPTRTHAFLAASPVYQKRRADLLSGQKGKQLT
jgi:2-phospho-L-lactate guanylyltransferase